MADITMCKGDNCDIKHSCYRNQATPCPYAQAYFIDPPYNKEDNGEVYCEHYWEIESPDHKDVLEKIWRD